MITHEIGKMIAEMQNDRNDGWTKSYYRETLKTIRDMINKALKSRK